MRKQLTTPRTSPGATATPGPSRRRFLGGAGMLLGGAAAAVAGNASAAAPEPVTSAQDGVSDAGRLTEHRRAYYEKARF